MKKIENAIDDVSRNPSPMVDIFEKDSSGKTIFFNDFNNWRRIESLKSICLSKKLGSAFSKLTKLPIWILPRVVKLSVSPDTSAV